MHSRSFSFITFAGVLILAMACSSDNAAGPAAPSQTGSLGSAIRSDIAASAGDAIASDLETLIANEAAAVGSFAVLVPSSGAFGDEAPASSPSNPPSGTSTPDSASNNPPAAQPNCTAGSQPGVFLCVHEPGPGDHLKCTYSEEKKLYVCVKQEAADSSPPPAAPKPPTSGEPQPAPAPAPVSESCSFNAAALIYSCVKSGEGRSVVKSYQFLDASGKPMEKFVRGVTEAIHFLVKSDASEANETSSSVSHSLRDVVESGFLGPNRVYNGFGNSADTNSRREDHATRRYTGSSVDTLKAVTFVDERAQHPYPLSGVAIRVVDYTVVSTGEQLETTTVHKRVVVTFNGTADVPISLGDYSCELHLDTHKVDGCK
ncbi:MAG TPA: hypothetical protein VK648_02040 [Gemmatimonadaceae bacterium]|nr:hypothetical protein [Gemmatimonadaceae bacterium]